MQRLRRRDHPAHVTPPEEAGKVRSRFMGRVRALVGVVMGSTSDWETKKHADELLTRFGVAHECRVMSAHRSPKLTAEWAATAEKRGLAGIIAAAGGAAHLAGGLAPHTIPPVLGV